MVWANGSALQQIFNNLLENSIDALARKRGSRAISIRVHTRSKLLTVEVEDNGPGIPAHVWPYLFCPFATFDKSGGTGLGLFIVARITSEHGGTIRVIKHRAKGARFVLQLPLAHVSPRASKPCACPTNL
jgi:signal transduction histidine kinase